MRHIYLIDNLLTPIYIYRSNFMEAEMYKALFVIIIVLLGAALIACSSEQKQEEATAETPETTTMVADTAAIACGGCDMQHTKAEMAAHEIDGETKYFCSDACKDHYMAKLEKEKSETSKVN